MKKNKVFSEFLRDFNRNLSNQNLFYPKTFSKSSTGRTIVLLLLTTIFFVVFCVLNIFKPTEALSAIPFLFFATILLVDIFVVLKIKSRRELKSNGIPLPPNWLKWDSDELNEIKIQTGFFQYQKVKSDAIIQYIDIAKVKLNEPIKNPFSMFEKYFDYAIKALLGVLFIVLISELNTNSTLVDFNSTIRLIIGLLLTYGSLAFIWKFMFLKMFLDKPESEKKRLREFIEVMQNILVLRKEKKGNGKWKKK